MGSAQRAIHQQSINAKEEFWTEAAQELQWQQPFAKVLDDSNKPFYKWFVGGKLNTCFNALDYHVENGRGESCAIIYDSPVTNTKTSYTYNQLKHEVALFAGVLKNLNVNYGDRVVIYMPMIPQAVIAMLACARIGAIHSVVFGGFAGNELAKRIDDAKPKVVIAASCGIEVSRVIAYKPLLDEALQLAKHCVESCVVYQRKECQSELIEDRDYDWNTLLAQATEADCALIDANHPLYILYTSGTTGAPKGVVRDTAGHAVALKWSIKNIYNLSPGDVFWTASDVGWVVGHSYIVYAPLLAGCTTLLYEGKPVGTPDAGAFWRVIDEHKVNVMFTAPTAIRAIKREDSNGVLTKKYPMKSLRTLFLAGERCDPDTIEWSKKLLNVPVIDHWWQTETGWGIAANCLGIEQSPIKQGSPGQAVPGYDVEVLDEGGHQQAKGELGAIVIKLPLPPGCLTTLWNDDKRFIYSYLEKYDGYYLTGDAGYIDEDNYVWVMSRIDDVINVAGHRLSTGLLEETISAHKDVAECAVIGANDSLKGQLPLALVVLKNNVSSDEEDIKAEIVQDIRSKVGAVAALKKIAMVSTLPKTRSGKVLRGTMRNIANGEPPNPPATILNPESIDIVMAGLATLGYPEINKE